MNTTNSIYQTNILKKKQKKLQKKTTSEKSKQKHELETQLEKKGIKAKKLKGIMD